MVKMTTMTIVSLVVLTIVALPYCWLFELEVTEYGTKGEKHNESV
jgi:hypothetical protein